MFEKMSHSSGNVIGYRVVGTLVKADYADMVPQVEALVREQGNIRLLLDMTEFKSEKAEAWGADMKFGRQFHDRIDKLAIVGDKRWEKGLAKLAQPFYAREARYFASADVAGAWEWLQS